MPTGGDIGGATGLIVVRTGARSESNAGTTVARIELTDVKSGERTAPSYGGNGARPLPSAGVTNVPISVASGAAIVRQGRSRANNVPQSSNGGEIVPNGAATGKLDRSGTRSVARNERAAATGSASSAAKAGKLGAASFGDLRAMFRAADRSEMQRVLVMDGSGATDADRRTNAIHRRPLVC